MTIEKFKNHYILIGFITLLKIILMGLFSSEYQRTLFMPFVSSFLDHPHQNPYSYFFANNSVQAFPYPPVMLLIMSVGGIFIKMFSFLGLDGSLYLFVTNVFFKLPLLFFDFFGFYFLFRLFPGRYKYITVLYFASPIIIYATYMHGQLDIVSTTLLLAALYYLSKSDKNDIVFSKQHILFVVLFSAALLTKHHVIAILPLLIIYMVNKYGARQTVYNCLAIAVVCTLAILPVFSREFIQMVLLNNEQNMLNQVFFPFLQLKLILPLLALLFIYIDYYLLNSVNQKLFFSFCGLLFSVFLVLLMPMPGWCIWVMPYFVIFFININNNKYRKLSIYAVFNLVYGIYFVFFHNYGNKIDLYFLSTSLEGLKIKNELFINIAFTIFEGFFIYIAAMMYYTGIASNSFYKRKNTAFSIGIAGDSGSGKSTLLQKITKLLGGKNVVTIEGDGDHKWERNAEMWKQYTHLNPKANYLYRQAIDISVLREGGSIRRRDYNHNTGGFTEEMPLYPKPYILIGGLHALYLPSMRKELDLKIFMDTPDNVRLYWKMNRDMKERGYSYEDIKKQIDLRKEEAEKYIKPQKQYADLVIHFNQQHVGNDRTVLDLELEVDVSLDVEPMLVLLSRYGVESHFEYSDDLEKQLINIKQRSNHVNEIPFNEIASEIIPQLEDITIQNIDSADDFDGIVMLVIIYLISDKMHHVRGGGGISI